MKTTFAFLISALLLSYLSSCTTDQAAEMQPVDTSCTHGGSDSMSYTNHIVPILTTHCTDPAFGDCHFAGSTYTTDLTVYGNVQAEIDAGLFQFYVLDEVTATMPKNTSAGPTELDACSKERLQLWIDQGYDDN